MAVLRYIIFIILILISLSARAPADQFIGSYNGMMISNVELKLPPDVKIEGIKAFIKTKMGTPFNLNDADKTIKLIYSTSQCSDVEMRINMTADNTVAVIYRCEPIVGVEKIEFKGVHAFNNAELEHAVYIQKGAVFYKGILDKLKERIKKFYYDNGYTRAEVTAKFKKTSYSGGNIVVNIDEGQPTIINKIEVFGNPLITKAALMDAMGIKKGETIVKNKIDSVPALLDSYYYSLGYWQVYISKPKIIYSENLDNAYISIYVDTGKKFLFEFNGNKNISNNELLDVMGIKKSAGFLNFELYKTKIEIAYKDRGFFYAKVDYHIIRKKDIHVIYNIHEGKKIYIAGIFFHGNKHESSSALKAQMLTSPWRLYAYIYDYQYNGILSPQRFEEDLKAIIYLYKMDGFLDVNIKDIKIDFVDKRKEWVNVNIFIDEGKQTLVKSIRMSGLSEAMNAAVLNILKKIKPNSAFDMWELQNVKRAIERLYFSKGYINASVDYNYLINKHLADISFTIKEGKRIHIGRIIIVGNRQTATWVIMENLVLKSGSYFIPDEVVQSRINLLRTGYFDRVEIKPLSGESGSGNTVDIEVILKERKQHGIEFSAGYSTAVGYRGTADIYDNNIMGTARSIDLHVGGGVQPKIYSFKPMFNHSNYITNQRDLELGYKENYLFRTHLTGRVNLIDSYIRNLWVGYSLKTLGAIVGVDKNIDSRIKLSLQYEFELREPLNVNPAAVLTPADVQMTQLGIISPLIFIDERNNPFNPTNGFLEIFRLDWAKNWFYSQEEYLKLYSATTKYIPLSKDLVWVISLRGGYAWPLGTTLDLPIEKRFYLGGGSTLRGFTEDSVGPLGPGNVPLGGDIMLNYQTELRIKMIWNFDGVIFTDGGNVWSSRSTFVLKGMHDIRKTAGVGLRYVTPAGALNIDIGFKLDRRTGEALTAWDFYIGTIL